MRRIAGIVVLLAAVTASCQNEKTTVVNSPDTAPSILVIPTTTTTSTPVPIVSPSPIASANPSPTPSARAISRTEAIDQYLTWFIQFAQERAESTMSANRRTQQFVKSLANTPLSPESQAQIRDYSLVNIAINKKLADDFQKHQPPAECAKLAGLYITLLNKSISVMENKLLTMNSNDPTTVKPQTDLSTATYVRSEMQSVNSEIKKLYEKYPALKTPRLELTQ